MNPHKTLLSVFLLMGLAMPAIALESVEVLTSTGQVREESFGVASPTPAWCWWESDPATGPVFQATNADGYGNYNCLESWSVHCDSDSLVFRGSWSPVESLGFASSHYYVDLSCSVTITADTRLCANRQVAGALDTDEHTLAFTSADGTVTEALSIGSGVDEVAWVLLPGTYQIDLSVGAHEYRGSDFGRQAYAGDVRLVWEAIDIVAQDRSSWGKLKVLYR